ncbi:MAG: hypothetical protein E6Q97_36190 [Desulfurellales bacterium]|nr:MAG: hypothetical protein E6Q97_36190 [Desulfurellales bacterium]
MAKKVFEKRFEDFRGVDYRSSDLTRPLNAAKQLTNGLLLRNLSLSGRKGGKVAGQQMNQMFSLHNYINTNTTTGATQEELLTVDEELLYSYVSATMTITRVAGATDFGYSMTVNEATNTFRFVLTQGGSAVTLSGNPYLDLGTGLESAPVTLLDLSNAIDATANFTCSLSTTAVNNYAAAILPLADYSPSTTTPRTITFYYMTPVPVPYFVPLPFAAAQTFWDSTSSLPDAQFLTFVNKKNVCYIAGPSGADPSNEPYNGRVWKYDGHGVYLAGMPGITDRVVVSTAAGALTGVYRYLFSYVFVDAKGNVTEGQEGLGINAPTGIPITLATNSVNLELPSVHINSPLDPSDQRYFSFATTAAAHVAVTRVHITDPSPFAVGDRILIMNTLTREYIRDTVLVVGRDGTGAYIEISTIVSTGAGDRVWLYPYDGFWDHCAIVNGNQVAVNTITVEDNSVVTAGNYRAHNSIVVGDTIYFYNRINSSYETRTVTSVTATTITFSGSAVTVNDEDVISANLRIRIYRTKAGGAEYYKVADIPNNAFNYMTSYNDNTLDTALGAIFNPLTEERAMPPKASLLTKHQGLMVASGIFGAPNRIAPSSVESPEYFSTLTPFDVESNITGPIRAIISDSEDMMAAFKDNAYYNVVGDLASSSQVVQIIREGQSGVSSQSSLARARDTWIGVGPSGFVVFKDGKVIDEVSAQVDPELLKTVSASTEQLVFRRASAINDWQNQCYICAIPTETSNFGGPYPNSTSKVLVYDYYNLTWYDWSYHSTVPPYGPFTFYQNRLYYPIWYPTPFTSSQLFKRHDLSRSARQYDYADNTQKITYDFWMQWDHGDEPSVYKLYERLKVYCMQPALFAPFNLRVRIYRDFKTATANFDTTLAFSTSADIEKLVKLLQGYKSRALSFRFTVDSIHTVPLITGYEYEISDSYLANDLKGKDT